MGKMESENISDFLTEWLELTSRHLSPNTEYVYQRYLKLLAPFLPNIHPNEIKKKQAEMIINDLLKRYKPSTVAVCRRLLATAFNKGIEWETVEVNPFKGLRIKRTSMDYTIWSVNDVERFLSASEYECAYHRGNWSYHVAFVIAIHTGMRKSEILGLRWENVDLTRKIIRVKESIHELPNKGKYVSGTKTRSSNRNVVITNIVADELRRHRKRGVDIVAPPNDYIITTINGIKPIHPRNLTKAMVKIIEAEKLPRLRFHDLRHTHASLLLANGVNPKIIQERLGHSKIDVTLNTYSHLLPTMQADAADLLDSIFAKKDLGLISEV
jgi:integrase